MSSRGTWTVPGGSTDACKLGSAFAVSMIALDAAISSHGEFRRTWARAAPGLSPDCPSPDELARIKRMLAILALDMVTGATLTITQPDQVTKVTAVLGMPPDTGLLMQLLMQEARGADNR